MPIYNAANHGTPFTPTNYEQLSGYSQRVIYGFLGLNDFVQVKVLKRVQGYYPSLVISVEMPSIGTKIDRIINFQRGEIYNSAMDILPTFQTQRIGTRLLASQVKKARKERFNLLLIHALGDPLSRNIANGYVTWGKLGYTMASSDHTKFLMKMAQNNRTETSLYDLLQNNENLWKYNLGDSWDGEFDLRPYSKNVRYLRRYLRSRQLYHLL